MKREHKFVPRLADHLLLGARADVAHASRELSLVLARERRGARCCELRREQRELFTAGVGHKLAQIRHGLHGAHGRIGQVRQQAGRGDHHVTQARIDASRSTVRRPLVEHGERLRAPDERLFYAYCAA